MDQFSRGGSQTRPLQTETRSGGFLAGAASTALGVAGGMLLARGVGDLFDDIAGDGLFEDAVASELADDAVDDAYVAGYEDAADDAEDFFGEDSFGDDDW